MMALHGRRAALASPGGVALADILANSVAVILILILATLVHRQEETRKELERSSSITSILARQLATSVVFNDLPSSPPSVLHDYDSCDIPHDCDPMLYPVLELHKGHIRLFNSNTRIYRAELLRQHNAFDRYLASLAPEAAQWIRLDIHSVSEYYLALGIMQEHGLRPRHWHYLGEDVPPLANLSPLAERVAGIGGPEDAEDEDWDDGLGSSLTGRRRDRRAPEDSLPEMEGTSLGGAGVLGYLEYDSLLPPAYRQAGGGGMGRGQQGGASGGQPQRRRPGDSLLQGQGQPGPLGRGSQALRLFIPNAGASAGGPARLLQVAPEDYAALALNFLFRLLEGARATGAFDPREHTEWLLELAQNPQWLYADYPPGAQPEALADRLPHQRLALRILVDLESASAEAGPGAGPSMGPARAPAEASPAEAPLAASLAPAQPFNRLLLPANDQPPGQTLPLRLGQPTPWIEALDGKPAPPQFLMRPHPSLYKGQSLALLPEQRLLLLPDEADRPELRWRPLAVIDRSLEYIAFGFVYAGMEEGRLALHAGINQLLLKGRPAANPRLNADDRLLRLTPSLWALALLALAGLLITLRLGRGRPQNA